MPRLCMLCMRPKGIVKGIVTRCPMQIWEWPLRTTLVIDDDVLVVARARTRPEVRGVGSADSELARNSLTPQQEPRKRKGKPLLTRVAGTALQ